MPYDVDEAAAHLAAVDPVMARLIEVVGPCRLEFGRLDNPFQSLLRSIVYQQLHSKAAATIHRRLLALFPGEHPDPDEILDTPDEVLRSAGLSRNKTAAAKDLARRTLDGTVPPRETLLAMADDEVIERLTLVRGVGPWTAEMVLIFQLGRPDVLSATDYGVRNGFRRAYGLEELPTPRELRAYGERWAPFRSVACWYLWRAADLVEWTAPKGTGWAGLG
jgi:DNA-3-methyladenine glycosylase II